VSDGNLVRFVGYSPKGPISAGTVLMDATADINGVAQIVSDQVAVEVPQARYDNLEIIYVLPHTTKQLARNEPESLRSLNGAGYRRAHAAEGAWSCGLQEDPIRSAKGS
jgi:hypothetical protein